MRAIVGAVVRYVRHVVVAWRLYARAFPQRTRDAIATAIAVDERRHRGEIRFAIEPRLPWFDTWRGMSPRRRAAQLFAALGVWETELACGVLIYVLLAEEAIEIHADRGIAARVPAAQWRSVCDRMGADFDVGNYEAGAVAGVQAVGDLLARHFPVHERGRNPNELDDAPVVL